MTIFVNDLTADVQYVAPRNPFQQTPNRNKVTVLRMYEHYIQTGLRFANRRADERSEEATEVLDECKKILAQYRAARLTGRTFSLSCPKHAESEAYYLAHIVEKVYERTSA